MPSDPRAASPAAAVPGGEPRPRRPVGARLARALLWTVGGLLGLVVVIVVLAVAVLQTDWGKDRVRLFALDKLRGMVQGRVDVASLGGDFLHGISLEGVSITGPAGEPFLSLGRLEVSYEIGGFLRKKILLGDVKLVEPRITLAQDARGEWNALRILPMLKPKEPPQPEEPGGWGSVMSVGRIEVAGGALTVATEVPGRLFGTLGSRVELAGLQATAAVEIEPVDAVRPEAGKRQRFEVEDLSVHLRQPSLSLRELDVSALVTPEGLELDRFLVRSAATKVSVEGTVRDLAAPVVDVRVTAEPISLAEVRRFAPKAPPVDGQVTGTVRLQGPADALDVTLEDVALRTPRSRVELVGTATAAPDAPEVDARIVLAPLDPADARAVYPAYPLDDPVEGSLAARGSRERTALEGRLAFGTTSATLNGTAGLPGAEPVYDLRLTVKGLDPQDVMREPRYAGVVNAELHAAGEGRRALVQAALTDSRLMGYCIVSAALDGRLAEDAFRLDDFRLALPRTRVRASGAIPFERPVDVRFSATSRNLQDLQPAGAPMPVGRFEVRGILSGPLRSLDARAELAADSLAARGALVGSLRAVASLQDLGTPGLRASVEGTASDLVAGGTAIDAVDLAADYGGSAADLSVSAVLDSLRTAEAHVTVGLRGATPTIELDRLALARGEEVWALQEPGRLVYHDGNVTFESFVIARGDQRIALDGTASLAGRQALRFSLEALSLEDLQRLAGREAAATGILSVSGTLGGTARAPVLESRLELERGRAGGLGIRRVGGRIDYADRRLRLDLEAVPEPLHADTSLGDTAAVVTAGLRDPGSVVMRGTIPVDLAFMGAAERFPDQPIDLVVESRDLSPELLQGLAPGAGEPPRVASLELELRLSGRPSAPLLDSRFALGEAQVGGLAIHSLTGTVGYAERELRLDALLVPEVAGTDTLSAPGSISLAGTFPVDLRLGPVERRIVERPIDVRLESRDFTLAALGALSPQIVDASGPIEIGVRLEGTPSDPRYAGRMTVRDGAFRYGREGARYSGITGSIEFDNDRITVPELRIASSGGAARLTGQVALRELTLGDVQARFTAEDFALMDQPDQALVVDADLTVGGTTQQPSVAGKVDVDRFEWPIPQSSDKDVIDLDEAVFYVGAEGEALPPSEPPPDVWAQTALDVDVLISHDAVLKNEKTLIAVQGDLSIDKARGQPMPSIAGELDVTRGFYSDFGKRFEVTRGEVRFFGTPELDPGLDVVAATTVKNSETGQDVEIEIILGGTASAPTLDFASTPEHDRSEIVSLLLFGTTTPGQGQEGKFEDTVGRLAAGQASAPLTRALSSELGLDLLEVQPGIGTAGGVGVRAGKYISPDVFVTYTQGSGPQHENQLGIQYRLSRSWTLETQAGLRGGQQQVGADLFHEFQY